MDTWKHGKYVDLWSLVHFLSGALLGAGFFALGFDLWFATALTVAVLLGWEVFEFLAKIIEPSPNVAVDILVGFAGFGAAAYYHYHTGNAFDPLAFGFHLTLTLLLASWGFLDYLKRGYR